MFKIETEGKPERGKVQSDKAVHIEPRLAVIPGTSPGFSKKPAGTVFREENKAGIKAAPTESTVLKAGTQAAEPPLEGTDGCGHAVNGEHIQRGFSHEPLVMVPRTGNQAAVEELGGPACQTAFDKIVFHNNSMGNSSRKYAEKFTVLFRRG